MRDAAIDPYRSTARRSAAGAPPLDDMVGDGPVSRGAPRTAPRGGITSAAVAAQRLGGGRAGGGGPSRPGAARGRSGPGIVARLVGRLPRIRPVKALTVGAFGVALVGIVANAMVFQRGHHPSPLFGLGRSVDGAPDAPAQRAAAGTPAGVPAAPGLSVPAPAAPAAVENTGTIAAALAPPAPAAAAPAKAAAPAHHTAKVHHDDPAKAKTADVPAPAAMHPRPGHPAAAHAKAETKVDGKADPLGKLLSGSAHPAKVEAKPAPVAHPAQAKPDAKAEAKPVHKPAAAEAEAAHPHHRLAAAAPAPKPAAQAE